ncbi:uncharacterized protein [Rutidosis leptorrhynchoides]|uniref:uncharacterized protein n=1 Tax=Rutidosis leptorrhynchoides TaxID=125765 RepID=UPI003A99A8B5
MSDQGERTCPLCAEEMDLTDQHLKPCKCGYDICVWCWHHIMDMAEKDSVEGRCPACRTPYNKEKIVGTALNCEGLVNGVVEKKHKSQKGKTKTCEGRNQLNNVRVIQRNLVYIVGLPLNLADEDLLQQKEYFGQYGKVLKVSISRTAAGAIQQFANSTCSVYITYSKEEEAVRSIQSAHGFVLEGRPLKACFGTTKYCHAWLRNTPCTNADCLYLHEFGAQEDSFTKDEIITAYTRNRVQQINGATYDMQRRFGNILPPPADDYSDKSSSAKPINKNHKNIYRPTSDILEGMFQFLPQIVVLGDQSLFLLQLHGKFLKSQIDPVLPLLIKWVRIATYTICIKFLMYYRGARTSNSQLVANSNGPSKQEADVSSTTLSFSSAILGSSFHGDELINKHSQENHNFQVNGNMGNLVSVKKVVGPDQRKTLLETPVTTRLSSSSSKSTTSRENKKPSEHLSSVLDKELNIDDGKRTDNSSCNGSSLSIVKNQRLQISDSKAEPLVSNEAKSIVEKSDLVSDLQNKLSEIVISEAEEDLCSFNDHRLSDKEILRNTSYIQSMTHISPRPNSSISYSSQDPYFLANGNLDPPLVDQNVDLDSGESSLISDILSMDFDPWDESLTSPRNLAKFLGQSNKQPESHGVLSARTSQNSNQSRFSFAREDECSYRESNYAPSASDFRQVAEYKNFCADVASNNSNSNYVDNGNGFSSFSFEESDHFATNYSQSIENNKISVSRTQVSAPPGFSGPKRPPPPGFTSHERMEQPYENASGNHIFDISSFMRKTHEVTAPVNISSGGDLELMDPAILVVGGRIPTNLEDFRSNFSPTQMNTYENDLRLQLLMQTSFSQQNPRFSPLKDHHCPHQTDSYGLPLRMVENNLSSYQPNGSLNVNGHWNGWNENDICMAEVHFNEKTGFNGYYSSHEDAKYQLPTSSTDLYNNRTFGI